MLLSYKKKFIYQVILIQWCINTLFLEIGAFEYVANKCFVLTRNSPYIRLHDSKKRTVGPWPQLSTM